MATIPLAYPWPHAPAWGEAIEVAPGVRWLRLPLPFALDHINVWAIADGEGYALVDTGIGTAQTRELWAQALSGPLGGRPVTRVFVTHYHPDHAGSAAWLCERAGARLWMTRGEFLTAHAVRHGVASFSTRANAALFRANGLAEAGAAALVARGELYRRLVPDFPAEHRRLVDGDRFALGGESWQVIVGYGHAPEHASFYAPVRNVYVAGDMLLPRISTNVAVRPIDPLGNPLRLFLASLAALRRLPEDVLVLPSHGLPFRGAHARIAALEAHHAERFAALERACAQTPRSAAELLETLFGRRIEGEQVYFALGEAIAHLHYLHEAGRLAREVGRDGVARFVAAGRSG